jgi:CRISPR-associated endonuclease/helicase Cas3
VIDEVHASDPYMGRIIRELARRHLDLGGYVLAMSATLGEDGPGRLAGSAAPLIQ